MRKYVTVAIICLSGVFALAADKITARAPEKAAKPLFVGVTDTFIKKYNEVPDYYVRALIRVGHTPFIIPKTADTNALARILDRADAVVISGGGPTVSSSLCTGKKHSKEGKISRDEFDSFILRYAEKRNMPVLGICRGAQAMNCTYGGTIDRSSTLARKPAEGEKPFGFKHRMYPYLGSATNPPTHTVSIVPGTKVARLIGTNELAVNSHHTWSAKKIAKGFRVSAYAPDGVVEAIEAVDKPFIGLQFHPEAPVACEKTEDFDIPRLEQFFLHLGDFGNL